MTIRPLKIEEADLMLEWKNYPETRKFALVTHNKITKTAHMKYMKDNIHHFLAIENSQGVVCGAIRLQDNEISIWIDRKFWGKGIATSVLHAVSKPGLRAKIAEGNVASMKCFVRAGFEPFSHQDGYYLFRKK